MAKEKKIENVKSQKLQKFIQKQLVIILIIILIGGLLYAYKSAFISAIVNGKPISRFALIKELDTLAKDSALNSLISKTLLYQEANKRKITVSKEDYDKAYKEILAQFQNDQKKFEEYLTQQKIKMQDFTENLKFQIMLEKMFAKKLKITEKELSKFIEENKSYFPQNITSEQTKKYAEGQLKQMKLNEEVQTLVNELRSKAKITIIK